MLEDMEGGVCLSLGGDISGLVADWMACLLLRTKAWLRVQVVRYCVCVDGGGAAGDSWCSGPGSGSGSGSGSG